MTLSQMQTGMGQREEEKWKPEGCSLFEANLVYIGNLNSILSTQ